MSKRNLAILSALVLFVLAIAAGLYVHYRLHLKSEDWTQEQLEAMCGQPPRDEAIRQLCEKRSDTP